MRRADLSPKRVLPSVVCLCDCEASTMRRPRPTTAVEPLQEEEEEEEEEEVDMFYVHRLATGQAEFKKPPASF